MRRLGLIVLLVAMLLATWPPRAWAHNAQVTALINLGLPHPGQESEIVVELLDVLGGDIPDAQVRVRFETSTGATLSSATLVAQDNKYRAKVSVPAPGTATFRLEVTLFDGLYAVQFPVQIRENTEVLPGAVFELYHSDAGAPSPAPQPPKPQPTPAPVPSTPTTTPAPATPPASTPAIPSQPGTSPQPAAAPTPVAPTKQMPVPTNTPPAAAAQEQRPTEQPAKAAPTPPSASTPASLPGQPTAPPAANVPSALPAAAAPAADGRSAHFSWVIVAAGAMLLISGSRFPRRKRRRKEPAA